jgi:hypothetical protein
MTKEEEIISITEATVAAYSNSPVWYKSSIIKYMNEFAKEQTTELKAEVESLQSQLAESQKRENVMAKIADRAQDINEELLAKCNKAEAEKVELLEKHRRDIQAVMNDANRKFM